MFRKRDALTYGCDFKWWWWWDDDNDDDCLGSEWPELEVSGEDVREGEWLGKHIT